MNSKIIICNGIHLHKDYKDVLSYSESDMVTLCQNHALATANNYSFIRERGTIQVGIAYSTCVQANYIAYQNSDYSNKWFFAFIDEVRYKNNNTTELVFTIDVWSTWYSSITFNSCFVEREHVTDDTIGLHTLPENVETGEYIEQPTSIEEYTSGWTYYQSGTRVVIGVTQVHQGWAMPSGTPQYNGVFSGLIYLTFPTLADAEKYLRVMQLGHGEDIYSVFLVPEDLVSATFITVTEGAITYQVGYVNYTSAFTNLKTPYVLKPTVVDKNYTPKNNKLFTFPYCYFTVSNNSGSVKEYHYEYFKNATATHCDFSIKGALSLGCSIKALPLDYNLSDTSPHTAYNIPESVDAGKLPTCSWITDTYTNWITQNSVNLGLNFAGNAGSMIGGTLVGDPKTALSGISGVAGMVGQIYQKQFAPNSAHAGANMGDLNFAMTEGFMITKKSIRQEYAKIIDDYFTARGYQVNTYKVPNIKTRPYFNYVKINQETDSITGNFANNFTEKLNGILKSGVTIWHNHDNIDNYSLDNRPVNN